MVSRCYCFGGVGDAIVLEELETLRKVFRAVEVTLLSHSWGSQYLAKIDMRREMSGTWSGGSASLGVDVSQGSIFGKMSVYVLASEW